MLPIENCAFSSVLRLKQGEYLGISQIAPDVADRLLPHFVVPPPQERDPEKRRVLTEDEILYETGDRIGSHWPMRTCLLDPRFLFKKFGEKDSSRWLRRLFDCAIAKSANPMPVIGLSDTEGDRLEGFRAVVDASGIGIALRLTLTDLGDVRLEGRVHNALLRLVAKPNQCLLIFDLAGADTGLPGPIADFVSDRFEKLYEIGAWRRALMQATSYPEKNPAPDGGEWISPRNEWKAWQQVIRNDERAKFDLMFGDYGADSAKFVFSGGSFTPICHLRYSTTDDWMVVRGNKSELASDAIKSVAERIFESGHFAGHRFSAADQLIHNIAREGVAGPRSAMVWRKLNTIHHLTRLASDLAGTYGYKIDELQFTHEPVQGTLF